jgi:hypothetical protein
VSAATPAIIRPSEADAAAIAALRGLCASLRDGASIEPACVVVQPNEIPHPADALLVHHEHMTEVLRRQYGQPVDVHVLDECIDGDRYTRKVALTTTGGGPLVEWGIASWTLRLCPRRARGRFSTKRMPLGAILISTRARRIKPRWFMPSRCGRRCCRRAADDLYGRIRHDLLRREAGHRTAGDRTA